MRDVNKVLLARTLFREGMSKRIIASRLNVWPTTISRWCISLDTDGKPEENKPDRFSLERKKLMNMDNVSFGKMSIDSAREYSSLLYWCEGSKYPSSNTLCFTSSDPLMCRAFISLLRIGFKLDEQKLRVWLQIHSDQNPNDLRNFWSNELKIPISQFIPPKVTKKNGGRYRQLYPGTCSIRYGDYSLLLRLMGIYSRFANNLLLQNSNPIPSAFATLK